ncbi:MAG: ORF6N domain-containing protein [Bacteroidales bacterium]|nr:ORF6N domain-containing protein [Bacteroidales bacterium]
MVRILKADIDSIPAMILFIRGKKVIIDRDLALLYGVKTKRLNEQVKRNIKRFPDDFMFQLTREELEEVVANCDHLNQLKFTTSMPRAFTEHGAMMVSGILNTAAAIEMSIYIVRAFIKLREILASHDKLERKIFMLEQKYDRNFAIVFEALKKLIKEDAAPRKRIGFKPDG